PIGTETYQEKVDGRRKWFAGHHEIVIPNFQVVVDKCSVDGRTRGALELKFNRKPRFDETILNPDDVLERPVDTVVAAYSDRSTASCGNGLHISRRQLIKEMLQRKRHSKLSCIRGCFHPV